VISLAGTYQLVREQWIPKPIDEAFAFFSRPENLEEITPPFLGFHIIRADKELHAGSLIEYKLRVRGVPMKWLTEITVWEPPYRFVDFQLKGPYKLWHHEHTFTPDNGGTRIGDHVDYALPFGIVGQIVHALMVRRDVESIFQYRQHQLQQLLGAR
jgi:ligand-binding SRPBCC domain-containing protein